MNVFDLFAKISLDTSEYEKGLSDSGGILDSFSSKFTNVLKDLSTKFFEFGKDCVSTGMDFDKAMSQVAATLGDKLTDENFDTLREFARETAKNTAFSATEVAEALNNMALAGYNVEQSMEMVPNVLNLASAGQLGLAKAADIVTKSQNAMGLSFEETRVMVDQMAAASSNSGTDVGQLGEAMLTIGANAKILKGGTAETITLLGTLANAAYTGAEGGTKLRNILDALSGKTDEATALLDKYNISLYDGKGKVRDINAVLTDMYKITSKMNDNEFMDFSKVVFNTRDKAAARKMIDSIGEYAGLLDSVTNSEGAAAEMARRQLDNLAGDVTLFKDAVEDVKISISDLATPYLREGVQKLTTEVGNFAGAFKANGIKGVASMFRIEMGTIKRELLNPFIEHTPDIGESAVKFLTNLANDITNPEHIQNIVNVGDKIIGGLVDGMFSEQSLDQLFDHETGMPKILSNICNGIVTFLTGDKDDGTGGLLGAATQIVKKLGDYFADDRSREEFGKGAQKILSSIANGLIRILRDGVAPLMAEVGKLWIAAFCGSIDYDHGAWTIVKELAKAFARNFGTGFKNLWSVITHPIESLDDFIYGGDYATDLGGVRVSQDLLDQYQSADTALDVRSWSSAQKIRNQYGGLSGMSDKEILQWMESGSWYAPDEWYNSLTDAERMELYAERNHDVKIPRFGTGGIVTKPTLAIVGENGPEKITPLSQDSGAAVEIRFGDIYVNGTQNAGAEVVRQIDEALRIWQIQQRRGIGGVSWQS